MKYIKRKIVRWALKQIKKLPKDASYDTLEKYGIADITYSATGEKAYILD